MKILTLLNIMLAPLSQLIQATHGWPISMGHCEKNISVKYQVPVMRSRPFHAARANDVTSSELFVDYEERLRWEVILICCPGYRTIIFGLCEPICNEDCPVNSFCAEPNKCKCSHGYEPSHHPNKQHQLICRPTCSGGCPAHSHCVSPNTCECRAGYRDVSNWFSALRCERVHCGPEHRYDASKHSCVRIEMSMEELMQRVAQRLEYGVQSSEDDDENASVFNEDDWLMSGKTNVTVKKNENVQNIK